MPFQLQLEVLLAYLFYVLHFTLHFKTYFFKKNELHCDEENNIYQLLVCYPKALVYGSWGVFWGNSAPWLLHNSNTAANAWSSPYQPAFIDRKTQHVLKTEFRGKDNKKNNKTPKTSQYSYSLLFIVINFIYGIANQRKQEQVSVLVFHFLIEPSFIFSSFHWTVTRLLASCLLTP